MGNSAGDTLGVRLSCRGIAAYYRRICISVSPKIHGCVLNYRGI